MMMDIALPPSDNNGIEICSDRKLPDLQYAENALVLPEDSSKLQVLSDCRSDILVMFGMFSTFEVESIATRRDWSESKSRSYRKSIGRNRWVLLFRQLSLIGEVHVGWIIAINTKAGQLLSTRRLVVSTRHPIIDRKSDIHSGIKIGPETRLKTMATLDGRCAKTADVRTMVSS